MSVKRELSDEITLWVKKDQSVVVTVYNHQFSLASEICTYRNIELPF